MGVPRKLLFNYHIYLLIHILINLSKAIATKKLKHETWHRRGTLMGDDFLVTHSNEELRAWDSALVRNLNSKTLFVRNYLGITLFMEVPGGTPFHKTPLAEIPSTELPSAELISVELPRRNFISWNSLGRTPFYRTPSAELPSAELSLID